MKEFEVHPDPDNPRLSAAVSGIDQTGSPVVTEVAAERPLTLFLNGREIVTLMTIGDHPDLLAIGYLLNQGMLKAEDDLKGVDYDADIETVVVRTARQTNYEDKLKKKTQTSGCAQGTVFGDLMDEFEGVTLSQGAKLKTSWLYALTKKINTAPSLYLKAGAIHGCVLCEKDKPLIYMEDVGRHNAVDKIAGYMFMNGIKPRQQDLLHDGASDIRDGDQDREDAHPRAHFALWLHRVGRGSRTQGRADADRARARQALRGTRGRGAHRVRRRCFEDRRGRAQAQAQGRGSRLISSGATRAFD